MPFTRADICPCVCGYTVIFGPGLILFAVGLAFGILRHLKTLMWISIAAPVLVTIPWIIILVLLESTITMIKKVLSRPTVTTYDTLPVTTGIPLFESREIGSNIVIGDNVQSETTIEIPIARVIPPIERHNAKIIQPSTIATFPNYTFDKEASRENIICSICIETPRQGDEMIRLPACIHSFHKNCIERWFEMNNNCPICGCKLDPLLGKVAIDIER